MHLIAYQTHNIQVLQDLARCSNLKGETGPCVWEQLNQLKEITMAQLSVFTRHAQAGEVDETSEKGAQRS